MTKSHSISALILCCSFAASLCMFSTDAHAATATYFVDYPNHYNTGTCHATLANWGGQMGGLETSLNNLGWSGQQWMDSNAWASDFIDSTQDPADGHDYEGADSVDLAIFNGHGNVNNMAFAYPDPYTGICDAGTFGSLTSSNIELGWGSGGIAAMLMAVTCCHVDAKHYAAEQNFGGNQILGFGSPCSLDSSEINEFFSGTGGSSGRNWSSWLNNLEDKPNWFTGNNTPVAVTLGWTVSNANANKTNCGLGRSTCLYRYGYNPSTSVWIKDWYWNGCGDCANCGK